MSEPLLAPADDLTTVRTGRGTARSRAAREARVSQRRRAPARPVEINAIGDWPATNGLAEAARRTVEALVAGGVQVHLSDMASGAPRLDHRVPSGFERLPVGRPAAIDLWTLNMNEFHLAVPELLRPPGRDQYAIAQWAWELPLMLGRHVDQLERLDEVWVPSTWVQSVMRCYTPRPVTVIPHAVEPRPVAPLGRRAFGLPERAFIAFFNFDGDSCHARKNPWAVVEAFARAFAPSERGRSAFLVLKAANLHHWPQLRARLEREVETVRGVLLDTDLPRDQMNALLACIDVYISLHRSEGFGLGIAEAMYLGKPVVVTAYSGNLDFTTPSNSALVGYRLRPITQADEEMQPGMLGMYEEGNLWAEPDVEQAARWLRRLYDRPAERTALGTAAAATISERCSLGRAGATMVARLAQVRRELDARRHSPVSSAQAW